MFTRIVAAFAVLFFVSPAFAEEMNADEKAVWALEEAYFDYVMKKDIKGYLSLWDERFVGWPSSAEKPVMKEYIAGWIRRINADTKHSPQYMLTKMAVRSFGDIVVTHYIAADIYIDKTAGDTNEGWRGRITHTWQRHGKSWQIITGMSSDMPHKQ